MYCDAPRQGLGCILMQNDKVIAYASRQLKKHELSSVGSESAPHCYKSPFAHGFELSRMSSCQHVRTVRMSARKASMSWVTRTRCSWVSSQNASKRSVSESTGSSRSGEGLGGAVA